MASVFKYYAPTEYNLDALIRRYFWFSKREFLNDPYDLNAHILEAFPKFKNLLEEYGYDVDKYYKTLNKFALCSFTQSNNNQHFWSLYADNFQGWCLEFDENNLVDTASVGVPNVLYDVLYIDEYPDLNNPYTNITIRQFGNGDFVQTPIITLLQSEHECEKLFAYLLRVKHRGTWEMEKEKRLILGNIYHLLHSANDKGDGYQISWKQGALRRIIIGSRLSDSNHIILTHVAKQQGIELKVAKPVLESRRFEIRIDTL